MPQLIYIRFDDTGPLPLCIELLLPAGALLSSLACVAPNSNAARSAGSSNMSEATATLSSKK